MRCGRPSLSPEHDRPPSLPAARISFVTMRQTLGRWYRRYVFLRLHRIFPRRSYSQYGEDVLLARLLGPVRVVIDAGANDGVSDSNTFLFVAGGARALLFEPIPETFHALRDFTWSARNVVAVNEGLSDREGNLEFTVQGVLSFATDTEDKAHSESCRSFLFPGPRQMRVRVRPMSRWVQELPEFAEPDFISIDVEGHERRVLEGIDLTRCRPRALVLETHGPSRSGYWLHRDYEALKAILREAGYFYGFSTMGNSIWIRVGDPAAERVDAIVATQSDVFADAPEILGDAIQRRYRPRA